MDITYQTEGGKATWVVITDSLALSNRLNDLGFKDFDTKKHGSLYEMTIPIPTLTKAFKKATDPKPQEKPLPKPPRQPAWNAKTLKKAIQLNSAKSRILPIEDMTDALQKVLRPDPFSQIIAISSNESEQGKTEYFIDVPRSFSETIFFNLGLSSANLKIVHSPSGDGNKRFVIPKEALDKAVGAGLAALNSRAR